MNGPKKKKKSYLNIRFNNKHKRGCVTLHLWTLRTLITVALLSFFPTDRTFSYPGFTEKKLVNLGTRHFVIITADTEYIWCSYFFGVQNKTTQALEFSTPLQLPKETLNFEPQKGLSKEDIHIDKNGAVFLKKIFPPGLTVVNIGFQIPLASWGDTTLTMSFPYPIDEFSVATPKWTTLNLSSPSLVQEVPKMLSAGNYSGIMGHNISPEQKIEIKIEGLPEGNTKSLLVASAAGILLFLFALFLTIRSQVLLRY